MKTKYHFSYDQLYKLFISDNLNQKQVADILNTSVDTIRTNLKKFNIKKSIEQETANRKLTFLKNLGVDNPMKDTKIRNSNIKIKYNLNYDKLYDLYVVKNLRQPEVAKELNLSINYIQRILRKFNIRKSIQNIAETRKQTNLCVYGVNAPAQTEKVRKKMIETQKNNNNFVCSGPELRIFKKLKEIYPNTIYQYTDERYKDPTSGILWKCDYYIPELDLFIEYQGYFTHGPSYNKLNCHEPFDKTNPKHLKMLDIINEKYTTAKLQSVRKNPGTLYPILLKVWTKTDPLKRKIAKNNKLKYIELWSEKEALDWIKSL